MACEACGHEHPTRADREACDAINGRVRRYATEGLDYKCELCGFVAEWSSLLSHFYFHHGGQLTPSGRLVRPVRTIEGGTRL